MNKRRHPGKIIQRLMASRGPDSEAELARRAGVKQPTLHRIIAGESKDPKNENLEPIARYYQLTVSQLRGEAPIAGESASLGFNVEPAPDVRAVPLISWVQAGRTEPVEDPYPPGEGEKPIYTSKRVGPRAFALRIRGDSMENPAGRPTFPDGCIIVVDPDRQANIGSFVVVRMQNNSEATFKQLVEDAGLRFLKPLNPRYPMIPLATDAELCGTWQQTIIDSD